MRFYLALAVLVIALALALSVALNAFDSMVTAEPILPGDILSDFVEMLLLVSAMAISVLAIDRLKSVEGETERLRSEVLKVSEAGADWRRRSRKLFEGLSSAILMQFRDWELTEAEADIAGLILKGSSLKQIAALRNTSEATIRQQAQGIYRKSGLANRAELSAYFLEDLFEIGSLELAGTAPVRPPN